MKLSTQILLAFSIIIMLSVADSYTNFLLSKKVERNAEFLAKSEAIIRNSNKMHKAIIHMQSAFRGYLLTDDSTFLTTYYRGLKHVPNYVAEQREFVKDDPLQRAVLDSISDLHKQWMEYSEKLINSRRNVTDAEGTQQVYRNLFEETFKKQVGKNINDKITQQFIQFDRNEYKIRKSHSATLVKSINNTHLFSVIFLSLTIVVGIVSTIYIVMLISSRIASMVMLAENISKGEFSIVKDTSNDELTGLSQSLNIMSEKLRKNIRELENRNTELNKFAYVVSHDLKAPIRGIHNVIKWIEEDLATELSPQMKKYLRIIPQRTQRMEALINGLLDYARISGETDTEFVDVSVLVHEIADSLVPRHFKMTIGMMPELYTERLKLEQVFANLISNAVKYTPSVYGHIEIKCHEHPKFFEFSVKDNGIGIDPEYHTKIFEIFQTLREKNEKESTGIGLAIVRKVIDEQQGTIIVKSQAGKGAEFTFTWPKKLPNEKT